MVHARVAQILEPTQVVVPPVGLRGIPQLRRVLQVEDGGELALKTRNASRAAVLWFLSASLIDKRHHGEER